MSPSPKSLSSLSDPPKSLPSSELSKSLLSPESGPLSEFPSSGLLSPSPKSIGSPYAIIALEKITSNAI